MSQKNFRQLHDALLSYAGRSAYADVLLPWLHESQDEQMWLRSFGQREGEPIPAATVEELWSLYALSRVCEVLILTFQDGSCDSSWKGPAISISEFTAFIEALGLTVLTPAAYCAFYHEVVSVEPHESADAHILAYQWPCVMLGNLLVLRGGVAVAANSALLRPGIADNSTLYWSSRRKARPHQDLSNGWGHNSQWGTAFRRDYVIGAVQYFNVDGKCDLASPEWQQTDCCEMEVSLTREERIELLTNRCFVRSAKPHADLWPYHDRIRIAGGTGQKKPAGPNALKIALGAGGLLGVLSLTWLLCGGGR
ncbi:hypothetical protein [Duganella vulcania]|uniref:Uncharacterized protein n=1 Tax=Duganella vulcania TaxID=2692166 RepID=A0A845GHF1_9BURK|nr:hypothetical protein [Duganella vulcania]MYM92940.1 hypothetical protein [Duganella vulcania]